MYTLEEIRWAVDEEVAGNEKFIYNNSCVYELGGKPMCLIGRALHRLGTSVETLAMYDLVGDDNFDGNSDIASVNKAYNILTPHALLFAREVQREQDGHARWGDARDAGAAAVDDYRAGSVE